MAIARIMCFGSGSKEDPEAKKSKEIEKQLREDQKRLAKEVKLLLLGTADCRRERC
jgi:guanine nucleotide-binding protein subunit alpha